MAPTLSELAAPQRTALLIFEMQRGVVGDLSTSAELRDAVDRSGVVARLARLAGAARGAGITVVHCTAQMRADRVGTSINSPVVAAMAKVRTHILAGTGAVDPLPELGPDPGDLVVSRTTGLAAFSASRLDASLRALRCETVVLAGLTLSLGILGSAVEAIDLGYNVVIPRDGVVDLDDDYGELVWRRPIALIATRTSVDELVDLWAPGPPGGAP